MNNDQLDQWRIVWNKLLDEFNAHKSRWNNDRWREPFQLLGAGLVHTHNAINCMPASTLHEPMRTAIKDSLQVWKVFHEKKKEPVFCPNTDDSVIELFSTMHLASSSFRLVTALFLVHEAILNQTTTGPLFEFAAAGDWQRAKLMPYLQKTKGLACCQKTRSSLDEKTPLAIILAHRDEFGHGEESIGGGSWRKERGKYAKTFPLCRVIEAQLTLASLGVKELSRIV